MRVGQTGPVDVGARVHVPRTCRRRSDNGGLVGRGERNRRDAVDRWRRAKVRTAAGSRGGKFLYARVRGRLNKQDIHQHA